MDPSPAKTWRLPWFYGWNVMAVAILFQIVVSGVTIISFSFWVTPWMKAFHSGRAPIIGAMTLMLLISGLASPTIGALLDKKSIRILISGGLVCFATGFGLISVATALWQVVLAYGVLMGVATTLSGSVAATILMSKWFRARSGLATALALTGLSIGGVVMPPLITALIAAFGWRTAAVIIGLIGLAIIPIVLLVVGNSPEALGLEPEPEGPHAAKTLLQGDTAWTTRQILLNPNFWPLVLAFVPLFMAIKAYAANVGPLLADVGIPAAMAAVASSVNNATTVVGKAVIGPLSDRFDPRLLFLGVVAITSGGFLLMMGHASLGRILLANVLLGCGGAGIYPMQGILIRRYFGVVSFGRVIGLLNLFFLFAAFGGQWAGAARDRFGSYAIYLALAAGAPLLGASAVLLMGRRWFRPRPDDAALANRPADAV